MFSHKIRLFLRTFTIALAACMLYAFSAYAAQGRINFSDPTVTAGDEVNVSMKITADEGTALGDATVMLTYPTDKLEFISGTDASGGAGSIRVHGVSNGNGTALLEYNLRFRTLSAGSASISVDSQEVYDGDDQPVELTHVGSSSITISAGSEASANSDLGSLEVYPGELSPAFSADVDTYSVTVGSGVDRLTINAIPADASSSVATLNNESLPMGDSTVTVTVTASDGTTKNYTINVSKVEGGPENVITGTEAQQPEGVTLSTKGVTITIMTPSEDVAIPEGLKEGTITIDNSKKVTGWVWDAGTESGSGYEYCVVYGMNQDGEVNFYRYDMVEKTIQRYFEDPLAAGAVSSAEYAALQAEMDAVSGSNNFRFAVICILAAFCFVLIMFIIYMISKQRSMGSSRTGNALRASQERARKRRSSIEEAVDRKQSEDSLGDDRELLKHNFEEEAEDIDNSGPIDETQVIRRPERKRRAKRVVQGEAVTAQESDMTDPADAGTADHFREADGDDDIQDLDI